jgi:hypothetical protein
MSIVNYRVHSSCLFVYESDLGETCANEVSCGLSGRTPAART